MIKTIKNVELQSKGIIFIKQRFRFGQYSGPWMNNTEYNEFKKAQMENPVYLGNKEGSQIFCYQYEFYSASDNLSYEAVRALILDKKIREQKRIDKAINNVSRFENTPEEYPESSQRRERISDEVKQYVWRRDEGKCVKCGSQKNLEYDHIIPFSLGGSNTERNIQLLCEKCNRSKGANLY